MYRLITIYFFCFLGIIDANAQITVETKTSHQTALIGDRITIEFIVKAGKEVVITMPEIKDTINNLLVIGREPVDTISKVGGLTLSRKIYITAFDSGQYIFPSHTFFYSSSASMMMPAYSKQQNIHFDLPDVSQMKDLKDIKPIYEVKRNISDYIFEIIAAIILISAIVFLILYFRKKKKPLEQKKERIIPLVPPIDTLMLELTFLRNNTLCEKGEHKLHFSKLSDAIRLYIEMKLNIPALESTSFDLLKEMKSRTDDKQFKFLSEILTVADAVKFAKHIPIKEEVVNTLEYAYKFAEEFENK